MIKIHALETSRAFRIVWLMEALGLDYDLVRYDRNPDRSAPDVLKQVHPLGKSPIIEDGGLTLAESSTILRYIDATYGDGHLRPANGTGEYWLHEEWLDYAESSFAGPLLGMLVAGMQGREPDERVKRQAQTHLGYVERHLTGRTYLMGDQFTLADIQLGYLMVIVAMGKLFDAYPALATYWERLQQLPSYKAAHEKAGSMKLQGT